MYMHVHRRLQDKVGSLLLKHLIFKLGLAERRSKEMGHGQKLTLLYGFLLFCFITSVSALICEAGQKHCPMADKCYNPITQDCCHDVVLSKQDGLRCCFLIDADRSLSYDPTTQICCGQKLVNRNASVDETCCGGQIRPESTGLCCKDTWNEIRGSGNNKIACCGTELYDMDIKECCRSRSWGQVQLHSRGKNSRCCGLKLYDTQKERCTPGEEIFPMNIDRCGNRTYIRTQQICCQGVVSDAPSTKYICCGSEAYQEKEGLCCKSQDGEHKLLPKAENRECCGLDYVDNSRQRCCNDKVIDQDFSSGLTKCCGDSLHNPETHLCCDGSLHDRKSVYLKCCAGQTYDNRTQQCFNSMVRSISEKRCNRHESDCLCNGEKIYESEKLCCFNKPTVKEQREDNKCCVLKDTGTIRTFNPMSKVKHPCQLLESPPDNQICCGNKCRHRKSPFHSCCGDKHYMKTPCTHCIDDKIITKNLEKCIRSTLFHPRFWNKCQQCSMKRGNWHLIEAHIKSCEYNRGLFGTVERVKKCHAKRKCRPFFELTAKKMFGMVSEEYKEVRIHLDKECQQKCYPKKGDAVIVLLNSATRLEKARKSKKGKIRKLGSKDFAARVPQCKIKHYKRKLSKYMSHCKRKFNTRTDNEAL